MEAAFTSRLTSIVGVLKDPVMMSFDVPLDRSVFPHNVLTGKVTKKDTHTAVHWAEFTFVTDDTLGVFSTTDVNFV